jgi:hypothetical protein
MNFNLQMDDMQESAKRTLRGVNLGACALVANSPPSADLLQFLEVAVAGLGHRPAQPADQVQRPENGSSDGPISTCLSGGRSPVATGQRRPARQ